MIVSCSMPGCDNVLQVGKISSTTKYVCKNHTRQEQVEAFGREYDSIKDHQDEDTHFQSFSFERFDKSSFSELRKNMDGDDSFMSGGHQIEKKAGATKHATRVSKTPEWALNNEKVQMLLLRSFPKLVTDQKQRERAGRWAQIIHLYYRAAWTYHQIAGELNISLDQLRYYLNAVRRASRNLTVDGDLRGIRKRGRPKKIEL